MNIFGLTFILYALKRSDGRGFWNKSDPYHSPGCGDPSW